MIYILYSDDYEVPLGGNYAQEKDIVIDTTKQVLSTCDTMGIPITLFCDLVCLWRYRELGLSEFPNLIDLQLKSAIEKGNDVQDAAVLLNGVVFVGGEHERPRTPGTRRALISKSSRATVRFNTRRLSGTSNLAAATVCLSAPPVAGWGLVTETLTGLPWSSVKAPSMTTSRPASTFPPAPPPVLYSIRTVPVGGAPLAPLPKRTVARSF